MKRCAIYTRKSTDEGLEQDFNSLDAQHEACAAYITSQKHEGWKLIRTRFDDGGYSGGSLNRPAVEELLHAVDRGEIDVVVVYKVDRLTRSLADFAKIVERFDERGVSFVSVTQQFNTTTSMGRLTLNVLLSFAQFEREVTAERIRDKIAASKKKGMWMGGPPPLGYDILDKKLVVKPKEAETVRRLFRLYLDLGTVRDLQRESARLEITTKRRTRKDGTATGGKPFSRGNLYQLLKNPLYIGQMPHKGKTYPGQHAAIVDVDLWETVQKKLSTNTPPRLSGRNTHSFSLLTGMLFDETGDRLCPTHANKKGKRYRYYISKGLMHHTDQQNGWRLPAKDIEAAVTGILANRLNDRRWLMDLVTAEQYLASDQQPSFDRVSALAEVFSEGALHRQREIITMMVERIDLSAGRIAISLRREAVLKEMGVGNAGIESPKESILVTERLALKRRGVETKLVITGDDPSAKSVDRKLCQLISNARSWFEALSSGGVGSVRDLAQREQMLESEITRVLPLAFLAPDIVKAILDGRQPLELTATSLRRIKNLPSDWSAQKATLGF